MSEKTKTTITPDVRLAAFGLFTIARQHEVSSIKLHRALNRMLGRDENYQERLSDLLWGFTDGEVSAAEFDEALKCEGITVEPDPLAEEASGMIKALTEATEASTDPIFDDAADIIRKLLAELAARPRT